MVLQPAAFPVIESLRQVPSHTVQRHHRLPRSQRRRSYHPPFYRGKRAGWSTANPPSIYFQGRHYLTYLRQQIDSNGVARWLDQFEAGVDDQHVLAGILGSADGFNKWS
jgi:hypothetical protein